MTNLITLPAMCGLVKGLVKGSVKRLVEMQIG